MLVDLTDRRRQLLSRRRHNLDALGRGLRSAIQNARSIGGRARIGLHAIRRGAQLFARRLKGRNRQRSAIVEFGNQRLDLLRPAKLRLPSRLGLGFQPFTLLRGGLQDFDRSREVRHFLAIRLGQSRVRITLRQPLHGAAETRHGSLNGTVEQKGAGKQKKDHDQIADRQHHDVGPDPRLDIIHIDSGPDNQPPGLEQLDIAALGHRRIRPCARPAIIHITGAVRPGDLRHLAEQIQAVRVLIAIHGLAVEIGTHSVHHHHVVQIKDEVVIVALKPHIAQDPHGGGLRFRLRHLSGVHAGLIGVHRCRCDFYDIAK